MMDVRNRSGRAPRRMTRRDFLVGATAMVATGLLAGCGPATPPAATLALVNGTLVDGTGADPVPDAALVIDEGRIAAVGPRDRVVVPAGAQEVDVGGATVLPGFINTHVHGVYDEAILEAWAQGGVTTVRDLGAHGPYSTELFTFRDGVLAKPRCARLVAVGSFVNVAGGYPIAYWGGHAITVDSPEDARQKVHQLIDDGADVVKTAVESGYSFGQSGWPLLSPEEMATIVEAAHERGKPVTVHVTSARDLGRALDAGVDEIAHMVTDRLSDELIARMVEAGTWWVPTLELWQGVSRNYPVNYGGVTIDNLSRFVEAGGEVALGTDYDGAPNVDFDLGMPIHEIEWMREAGMTPMQIIVAATQRAARSCNRERELGTLEVGKAADVLIVEGDPLADVQALTSVKMVIRDGRVIRG